MGPNVFLLLNELNPSCDPRTSPSVKTVALASTPWELTVASREERERHTQLLEPIAAFIGSGLCVRVALCLLCLLGAWPASQANREPTLRIESPLSPHSLEHEFLLRIPQAVGVVLQNWRRAVALPQSPRLPIFTVPSAFRTAPFPSPSPKRGAWPVLVHAWRRNGAPWTVPVLQSRGQSTTNKRSPSSNIAPLEGYLEDGRGHFL